MNEEQFNLQRDNNVEADYRDSSRPVNNYSGNNTGNGDYLPELVSLSVAENFSRFTEKDLHHKALALSSEDAPETKQRDLLGLIRLTTWAWMAVGLPWAQ